MKQGTGGTDVLTLREVAAILRCSKTHVSNVVNGKVDGVPTLTHVRMGRRIMIRSTWLHDWMEANKVSASI
jgi:excisionase family DNA binding protein